MRRKLLLLQTYCCCLLFLFSSKIAAASNRSGTDSKIFAGIRPRIEGWICSEAPLGEVLSAETVLAMLASAFLLSLFSCEPGTLAMVNLASKYLDSGSLGRPPLLPSCLQPFYKSVGVPLDSAVAPQVPANGASTSSVLSLLTGYQNQMPVVTSAGLPSFGASSPRRALDGGMRRLDVPHLVVPSA